MTLPAASQRTGRRGGAVRRRRCHADARDLAAVIIVAGRALTYDRVWNHRRRAVVGASHGALFERSRHRLRSGGTARGSETKGRDGERYARSMRTVHFL
jgi:hypothetical protein